MRITFVTRKFGNVERNSHCDVLHITPIRVAKLFLDCNGDFEINAYGAPCPLNIPIARVNAFQSKTPCNTNNFRSVFTMGEIGEVIL